MSNKNEWPLLLIDEEIVRRNVRRMKKRADEAGCVLRPHFKTHQSAEIGEWIREEGVEAITVSSLGMALYFADAGWKDILIAMPVNILLLDELKKLSERLERLVIMVDHPDALEAIAGRIKAGVVIEVDTGSNRTGVPFSAPQQAKHLLEQIEAADGLQFEGFYSHAGHHYAGRGEEDINSRGNKSLDGLLAVRDTVAPGASVFFGDTPYASVGSRLKDIDVLTPGNFVFYDMMQVQIGSCSEKDIAICLACPVISVHAERNELAIHGGGVHLAKDVLEDGSYGRIVRLRSSGWSVPLPGYKLRSISQEHGIVSLPEKEIADWKVGDVLGILPVHSCMTAEAMGGYKLVTDGLISHYRKKKPV